MAWGFPALTAAHSLGDLLVGYAVHQDTDAGHLDLDDVAWNQESRRVETSARAGRRPSGDDVSRLEGGEGRNVADEIRDREKHVRGRVVLSDFAVDASRQVDAAESVELVRGRHPGADRSRLVEVLARSDIELRVA